MRVIGGEFRSRRLKAPPGADVRPTPDRLREALFNILTPRIEGVVFLDAYAGCGSVGIEAISRGAGRAIFLEKSRPALRCLEQNIQSLGIGPRCEVHSGNAAPVITNFQIDRFEKIENQYTLEGSFHKTRPCDFISLNILAETKAPLIPNILVFQMKDETIFGGDAPTGTTTWGPVTLPMPPELLKRLDDVRALEVRGVHRCHALWNQETTYGYIPIERIPK